MRSQSTTVFYSLFACLAAVMVATRFKHFGDALHMPDASMAVFFLGGVHLRRHAAFVAYVALAVLIDEISIHYLGISDFCMTAAYAFVPLAYAVLWYAGRLASRQVAATPRALAITFAAGVVAAILSFALSNGSFYWLGGRYAHPHVGEYLARLVQWGPLFVRTTATYLAVALLVQAGVSQLISRRQGVGSA